MMVGMSLLCYLLRMNISVAQQFMVPELGLSDVQVGQIFSAFMIGYALFQIPAGVWGDHSGPRVVLTAALISWGFLTLLTGFIPGLIVRGAAAAFLSLLVLRFVLGMGEAAMYPVAGRVVANWMPLAEHAFSNAVVMAGNTVGAALAPPLIAFLMQNFGWRFSFYVTGLLPFGIAGLWWWQARDRPDQHPAVNREELAVIAAGRTSEPSAGPGSLLVVCVEELEHCVSLLELLPHQLRHVRLCVLALQILCGGAEVYRHGRGLGSELAFRPGHGGIAVDGLPE